MGEGLPHTYTCPPVHTYINMYIHLPITLFHIYFTANYFIVPSCMFPTAQYIFPYETLIIVCVLLGKCGTQLCPVQTEPPNLYVKERVLYFYLKSMENLEEESLFFLYHCQYFILLPDKPLSLSGYFQGKEHTAREQSHRTGYREGTVTQDRTQRGKPGVRL